MTRIKALIADSVGHLLTEFLCFYFLSGFAAATAELTAMGVTVFLILTFGLRPFSGRCADRFPRTFFQPAGLLILCVGSLFLTRAPWAALPLLALGSAVFHTGGAGENLIFAKGHFSRFGIFAAGGGIGAALGILLRQIGIPGWLFPLLTAVNAIVCLMFTYTGKYPRRIKTYSGILHASLAAPLSLGGCLFVLFLSATSLFLLPTESTTGLPLAGLCLFMGIGRFFGGILADRIGPRRAVCAALLAALPCLSLFSNLTPMPYFGAMFLGAALPALFCGTVCALPAYPRTAFGLSSLALLLGLIPGAFFAVPGTREGMILSGSFLLAALTVSFLIFTDDCRSFRIERPAKPKKTGEGRK